MWHEWRAAALRHTPPTEEFVAAGQYAIAPAAGSALLFFALALLIFGKRVALPAAALAMIVGFGVANYYRGVFPWWPSGAAWHWLPLLFLMAQIDGLLGQSGTPGWGRWRLRLGLGLLAALVLVPPDLHHKWPALVASWPYPLQARFWPLLAFTLAVALGWAGSEAVARQSPGGTVGLGLSLALFGAGFVMAHAHSARFADALSIPASALLGISLVAFFAKVDIGTALPGVALILPSILLVGFYETFNEMPWYTFLLAGLPPLTIGLLALPALSRMSGFGRGLAFWLLCLGPTVAAVIIAVRTETLLSDEW
jgi:hypothetical protein